MRVYWIDEIIQYIEEKVVDYLLENSVRRQINKVERKFITKKYQKDLEEMVLKKYGREPFYDQLCQVLFKNNTLERIMKKVYDRNLDENVIKEERLNLVCSKMSISAYNQSMVSNTRYIDLNYYDYTNQNYTLRYSGTKNRIENYSVRKGELDTYPEHNCTVAFRENEDTFDQVRKLIDQVSNL